MLSPTRTLSPFQTAARGLEAQRIAMGVATENIANATTSRTEDGTEYRAKRAVHESATGPGSFRSLLLQRRLDLDVPNGRHLAGSPLRTSSGRADLGPRTEVVESEGERLEYDPEHPHADENGYVHYPDINVVEEMARMISANRVYEANLSTVKATKEMIKRSLEI